MQTFIKDLPKAELHVHIEGSVEPELMLKLSQRNGIVLPYDSLDAIRSAYEFKDPKGFWEIYYQGLCVLLNESDFYDLTWAYLEKAKSQNIRHAEIFVDPKAHTDRGIPFETVIQGMQRALQDAQAQLQVSAKLIMIFPRHIDADVAMGMVEEATAFKDSIIGIGLDLSPQPGHEHKKFTEVFERARKEGFLTVAHCANAEDTWQALEYLKVSRIDHGVVCCLEDAELMAKLKGERIPLTVCPLSNVKVGVFSNLSEHPIKDLFDQGLCVTINSDDPTYCGGYVTENFLAIEETFHFSRKEMYQLSKNAFEASFLSESEKQVFFNELDSRYQE